MKTRQTIHALFGITLILEIFLGGYNIAHAQINTGVEASIRDFLCTPAVKNANNQTVRTTQGAIPLDGGPKVSSTKNTQLITCINRIYRFSVYVASIAAVFLFVWAGYMYMTDSGDEKRVTTARSIMFSTIIGLIILASTYVMLRFINPDLVNIPEFSAVDAGIVTDDQIDQRLDNPTDHPDRQRHTILKLDRQRGFQLGVVYLKKRLDDHLISPISRYGTLKSIYSPRRPARSLRPGRSAGRQPTP